MKGEYAVWDGTAVKGGPPLSHRRDCRMVEEAVDECSPPTLEQLWMELNAAWLPSGPHQSSCEKRGAAERGGAAGKGERHAGEERQGDRHAAASVE